MGHSKARNCGISFPGRVTTGVTWSGDALAHRPVLAGIAKPPQADAGL